MDSAARRLVWGKCLNAGQTCIAPDYVLVAGTDSDRDRLVGAIERELEAVYGDDRLASADYSKVIHRRHCDRLVGYLDNGRMATGGRHDSQALRIEPTVVVDVPQEAAVLPVEAFG